MTNLVKLAPVEQKKLLAQLERLCAAVEELLLTGLTTASEATRQTLGVTFQHASRLRLLRLSGTLRVANEELGRFTRNEAAFSQRRLVFFLNRAWLLGKGIARALREDDAAELQRLLWTPPVEPVQELHVVTLGAVKKVAAGAFCAFEFRLRSVGDGKSFVWSTVFPLKSGMEIPPEGFLHLPQKQKFTASVFLERKVVSLTNVGVTSDETGRGRIQLGENSTVAAGEEFADWERFLKEQRSGIRKNSDAVGPTVGILANSATSNPWAAAIERIQRHEPGPFDLDVELQEEVLLEDWQPGDPQDSTQGWTTYPLLHNGVEFDARVSHGVEGKATRKRLDGLRKKKSIRPPLFGLLHYETCRLVFQPLTLFPADGPQYITISEESIDRKALLQTLKFT
jgi:hypothetical protein